MRQHQDFVVKPPQLRITARQGRNKGIADCKLQIAEVKGTWTMIRNSLSLQKIQFHGKHPRHRWTAQCRQVHLI